MQNLSEVKIGQVLSWTKGRGDRSYTLQHFESDIAQLAWNNPFGSTARGETADGVWTLKRMGFLQPIVTVRREGQNQEIAVLRHRGRQVYMLEMAGGRSFNWKSVKLKKQTKGFYDDQDRLIMSVTTRYHLTKISGEVAFERNDLTAEALSILVLVAWYYIALEYNDDAATTVVMLVAVMG